MYKMYDINIDKSLLINAMRVSIKAMQMHK